MITSQGCNRNNWLWILFVLGVTACASAATATPGATRLPTFGPTAPAQIISPSAPPTPLEAERLWKEVPVGSDTLVVTFYTDANQNRCLRYTFKGRNVAPVSQCSSLKTVTLLAVQGAETDSAGQVFSIIAGRAFDDQITAVSLEFSDGGNTPAEVTEGGFAVVLPGKRTAIRAIPIDQYGNLVGEKFALR